MTRYRSEFLGILDSRGLIENGTDLQALDELLGRETVTGYIGFDCTAPSLHAGHLVQIFMLRWLQQTGHRPVVLLGGGTTRIGDPSGRDKTRQLLDAETIATNRAGIRKVFESLLSFGDGPGDAILADNSEWLERLSLIDFPARLWPAFLGRPDAQLRPCPQPPRAAGAPLLPRVQLHGPAGL